MGTLRAFLALSVVLWHIGYFIPVTGETAVICFYMISGFYMSMVINGAYKDGTGWQWKFYLSRFLRLYPTYWVVAAGAFIAALFIEGPVWAFDLNNAFNPVAWAAIIASNIAIWGLDVINFITKAGFTHYPLMRLVGPAWTLGIELQFYLVAPFIVTRSLRFTFGVLAVALGIHFALIGLPAEWRYYLAPAAWCFFIMGFVSHRVSELVREDSTKRRLAIAAIVILPILAIIAKIWYYEDTDRIWMWIFYFAFAAGIPYVFHITKNNLIDNAIGGLSYPMYLVHFPLLQIGLHLPGLSRASADVGQSTVFHKAIVCLAIVTVVIAISAVLHFGLERRIDMMRANLRARRKREVLLREPIVAAGVAPR